MDNNPIKYSDLVQPDSSITDLIQQLSDLIAEYEKAKSKIQGAARDLSGSMQSVAGATEEQRKQIELITTQSEKLAKAYADTDNAERETFKRRQQVIQAVKEEQRIDKLVVEINNSKAGSYNRLSAQYRLNKIRLNEMSAEERTATKFGRELETETRKIYEEMSRLQKATGKYTLEVGHYENALRGLPGPIGQVVSGFGRMREQIVTIGNSSLPVAQKGLQIFSTALMGTVGIVMAFVRYLTGSAKTIREFEQANADLSTILGVNVKEMTALTNSALALGRSTEWTARQVTELQTELAKLGFNQGEIINMEESVLRFATAVGANLSEAASVAGSTLRAFGLSSRETDDALATLAVATNNSALSFHRIEKSVGLVFPVMNAYGLSVKDTAALLGGLADAGLDASSAATATRNIMLNLADSNGKLAKALGGSVSTFDEIIDGMIRLRDSGIDVAGALELTDKRSVAAFAAFMQGAEDVKALRQSLEDVDGELERIAEERLNTVEGSTKKLKSAWEGLTLSFRESQGEIKKTIDWLTKLITKFNELLFPKQAVASAASDKYLADFQKMYADYGEEVATGLIKEQVRRAEKLATEAADKAEKANIFGRIFGRKGHTAKQYEGFADGVKQAADIVYSQMEADAEAAHDSVVNTTNNTNKELSDKEKQAAKKAADERNKRLLAAKKAVVEAVNDEISVTEKGSEKMLDLRLAKIEAQRQVELEENRQKVEAERKDEALINAKYDKKAQEAKKEHYNEVSKIRQAGLQKEEQALQLQLQITRKGSDEELQLRPELIEKQRQIEKEKNKQLTEEMRQEEAAIDAKYDNMVLTTTATFYTKRKEIALKAEQDLASAEFDLLDRNERQKTIFRLKQEKKRLEKLLEINAESTEKMTDEQVAAIRKQIEGIDKQIGKKGYSNIYEVLGINLDAEQQSALNTAFDSIKEQLAGVAEAWKAAADAAVESANKQVEEAQKALDAEIEAREQGYANNVEMAQKELSLAQQQQTKALQEQKKAQKAQVALDSLTQASSLITASANIWKSLSGIPYVGYALAIGAIASMWGSFAAAKVKAAQVTTETYGEGTVELLEGGSHASGHDVDLGTKSDGTRRRAEGGEFFAVINKRNSRRFRRQIPDVINSLNDGTFFNKYVRANEEMSNFAVNLGGTDISGVSRDVRAIREQGESERYVDGKGAVVVRYKNLTRKIKS